MDGSFSGFWMESSAFVCFSLGSRKPKGGYELINNTSNNAENHFNNNNNHNENANNTRQGMLMKK